MANIKLVGSSASGASGGTSGDGKHGASSMSIFGIFDNSRWHHGGRGSVYGSSSSYSYGLRPQDIILPVIAVVAAAVTVNTILTTVVGFGE
jgi:hypothetical protein